MQFRALIAATIAASAVSIPNARSAGAKVFIPEVSVSKQSMLPSLFRSISAAAILSAAIASPAFAQDAASTDKRDGWSLSIGADPTQRTGSPVFSENLVAAVAREWARPNSGLGFRTQLTGALTPSTYRFLGDFEGGGRVLRQKRSFVELSAATTYTFRRNRNFKPYLLAGPALYGVKSSYTITNAVLGGPAHTMDWVFGATAGAGLNFKILGKDLLLEQRILIPASSTDRMNRVVRPFTLGIRF